jgi:deoxyribodipyrimidine photolyase-related protein
MTPRHRGSTATRDLVVVFGDQLHRDSIALREMDPARDAVLMMEVDDEATYVVQHKKRLVLFLSAMRHFRDVLRADGLSVHYAALDERGNRGSFRDEIPRWLSALRPERLIAVRPGDHRVLSVLERAAAHARVPLVLHEDEHFLCTPHAFRDFARGRKTLTMENFYRRMRRETGVLMQGAEPAGGRWNYDEDNRERFGAAGPGRIEAPRGFRPDPVTREVMALVASRFADHPGDVEGFDYPVTAEQARAALDDFVARRLARFGRYQDAMAAGEPYLYHSRLSCVLNLHLLDPRDAIAAAVAAYERGDAPIAAVEGFVRQILGWREFVRGVYWLHMPDYAGMNTLDAHGEVPAALWGAGTDMVCIGECVKGLVDHAYAHHIQRLMVLGLWCQLLGVHPYRVHEWHMAMYADAVDWVSLPNVLGMSQHGDGGIVGSKPYVASGNYISRMSDYCGRCRYDPRRATGDDACPVTTLYWDFLARHRSRLRGNRRMGLQLKNLERKGDSERRAIGERAQALRRAHAGGPSR